MRLVLDPRAWRLLRRLPRTSVYSLLEIALLSLLAIQGARLLWAVATPVDPLGEWRLPAEPVASGPLLTGGFDPFFRLSQGSGQAVVTSLQLSLYGVRVDEAIGRGSAIIAGPDGVQTSYAVGDEILPGVTLKSVAFDNVVILRGTAEETLFLDQSTPAPIAQPTPAETNSLLAPAAPGGRTVTPAQLQSDIQFVPRTDNGRVTGFIVRPQGSGAAFRAAGFADGDIIVAVGGQPVTSAAQLQQAAIALSGGGNLTVSVERGSSIVPIAISVSGR